METCTISVMLGLLRKERQHNLTSYPGRGEGKNGVVPIFSATSMWSCTEKECGKSIRSSNARANQVLSICRICHMEKDKYCSGLEKKKSIVEGDDLPSQDLEAE